jgi:hypothetical protein
VVNQFLKTTSGILYLSKTPIRKVSQVLSIFNFKVNVMSRFNGEGSSARNSSARKPVFQANF